MIDLSSEENNLSKKAIELISNWPDNISYPSGDEKTWGKVATFYSSKIGAGSQKGSLFYVEDERSRLLNIFIMSMCIGKNRGIFSPWESLKNVKPQSNMPKSALKEDEIWLMTCVAISHTDSTSVVNDPKQIVSICEGYANGGISLLMSWDSKKILDQYESELEDLIKKLN